MTPSKRNQTHSIFHYLVKGPRAVERRLGELERESKRLMTRLAVIRVFLRSLGFKRLTPKVRFVLKTLGNRTLAQIKIEQKTLQLIIGSDLRAWELNEPALKQLYEGW